MLGGSSGCGAGSCRRLGQGRLGHHLQPPGDAIPLLGGHRLAGVEWLYYCSSVVIRCLVGCVMCGGCAIADSRIRKLVIGTTATAKPNLFFWSRWDSYVFVHVPYRLWLVYVGPTGGLYLSCKFLRCTCTCTSYRESLNVCFFIIIILPPSSSQTTHTHNINQTTPSFVWQTFQ